MLKTILFAAVLADVILTVSSTGSKCGPCEQWMECPNSCEPKTCSQLGFPQPCPAQSSDGRCPTKPGCVCKDGYVKNEKGDCILKENCPSCGGDENAVSGCGNCRKTCANYNSTEPIYCTQICYANACDCKKNYVLDTNTKTCVLPKDCTPTCGPNEVYDDCINGGCHNGRTCEDLDKLNGNTICLKPKICKKGCLCKKGYYRNKEGVCVQENECPNRQCGCRPNEKYVKCPVCGPKTCAEVGYPLNCTESTNGECTTKPGCTCDAGYVRDKGICIPIKQCPSCGGDENAVSGCGNCRKTCANYNSTEPIRCTKICYPNACDCKKGYVLDGNTKTCVLPKDCTPTCGPNEVYDDCINGGCHSGRTCEDLDKLNGRLREDCVICSKPKICKKGCLCKKGYYRNKKGVCVQENECPNRQCGCRPNEKYVQCPVCGPKTCAEVGFPLNCTESTNGECTTKPGCTCDAGYVRDKGICIPIKQCPSCGGDENAVSGCGNCRKTCANYNSTEPIRCTKICYPNACDCKKGYVLDGNTKTCVLPKDCTPTCGPNEVYDDCINGGCHSGRTCEDLDKLNGTTICLKPKICKKGCLCKKGYYRNKDRVCVQENECPNRQCGCRAHEKYVQCPVCGPKTCAEVGYPLNCTESTNGQCTTKPGCTCDAGYVRNYKGICIPIEQCPSCGGDENAVSGCGNCPKTCANYNSTEPIYCIQVCYANACDCKKGYVLDGNTKKCVPPKDCTPTCGPNEVYDSCANGGCHNGRTCEQLQSLNGSTICVDPIKCEQGCVCKKDYYRNDKGVCVPAKECPQQCGPNERYMECPDDCIPKNCSQVGYPIACLGVTADGSCPSKPGCVCIDGYVKNYKDICIPIKQCPSCGGDENAENGCGNCPKTCENYNSTEPQICPQFCNVNGCDCREGYVLDRNTKRCVRPKDCSPSCGPDEVYDSCSNGGCHNGRTCKDQEKLGNNTICVEPKKCKPGCVCKKGLYRNKEGVCVTAEECQNSCTCESDCGPNEVYVSCINGGCHGPITCKDLDTFNGTAICGNPDNCQPGCMCKHGYLRNDKGRCIPENKCPNSKCKGDYETYVPCDYQCTAETCDQLGYPLKCFYPLPGPCPGKPACLCRAGYVKDKNGKCIPIDQCPSCGGDPNAKSGCGACGKRCSNYFKGPQVCNRLCIINGCDCKENYVLDDNTGKCVLPKKCTPTCGQNERYTDCIESCSEMRCGQSASNNSLKSKSCTAGCVCQDGYRRNCNGVCVAEEECSLNDKCVGNPNEFWDTCPSNCEGETCDSIGKVFHCPLQPAVCRPRCRCAKGYYRNSKGVCVSEKECYQCGKNEIYDKCVTTCPPRQCGINDAAVLCAPTNPEDCKPGCRCQDGHSRTKEGVCVPTEECPPENPCTKANEVYDECPARCPPRVCGIDDRLIDCAPQPLPGDADCPPPTCRCADGYYRDDKDECVKWEDCPKCPKGEHYDPCPNPCPGEQCSVDERVIRCKAPPQLGDPECKPGCRCPEGYKRNDKGICVPKEQCPAFCYGANEVSDPCPNSCDPNTCESIGKKYNCPNKKCTPACRCKPGYYRNKRGECIAKENCLKCKGPNEYFACGGACDNVCATLSQQNQTSCPIINIKCNDMCYCVEGYARNRKGTCVPISSCRSCKGVHEYIDNCPPTCPPDDSCDTYGKSYNCPSQTDPPKCGKPTCRCEDNYLRNKNGECVPQEQCPCNGDPNAKPGCGCSKTCSDYYANKQPTCTKICKINACDCKEGYVLDEKSGKCVLPKNCPAKCPKGEHYEQCPNPCPGEQCSVDERVIRCKAPPQLGDPECKPGCRCPEGYKRDDKGICVPKEQCPAFCYGANEISDPCPNPCDPNTCESIGKEYDCPNKKCTPACRCKPGYYRNKRGECIAKENCLKCKGPNEYFACGGACDNVCATLSQQNQTSCPIINIKCNDMCYCVEGYARNRQGTCVPISSCRSCKGVHEYIDNCPPTCPPDDSCDTYGKSYNCPSQTDPPKCGKPTCRCEDNYLRNKNGECVPQEQCPCNGDPNAKPGCGCSKTCSDYYANKQPTCTKICKINACDCKEGYVLDEKCGKCVLPKNCPAQCPQYEVYDTCPANCPPETCPDGRVYKCPSPPEPGSSDCKPRCRCEKGYYRNDKGKCIPKNKCPSNCCK